MMLLPLILAIHAPSADGDLIARLQRRDPQALAELYDRYGRIAYSLILRVVRDSGIAEDLVQETFLRVCNRVHGFDAEKGAIGSVIYDLDVPDFYKAPFSMSGLTLTSLAGAAMMTARPDEQLKTVLPAPPIGLRTFPQNDELALFAEIYDNSGKTPHKIDIVTSVLTDEGKVVFKTEDQRDSSELGGGKGGYGYSTRVPLSEIPPGLYVLSVDAKSRLGNEATATRQVQFRVVSPVRGPQQ